MLKHLKFKNMIINTNSWHQTIFPAGNPTSIFAFNMFHYQVRYGLKWFHINEGTKKKKLLLSFSFTKTKILNFANKKKSFLNKKIFFLNTI